MDGPPAVVDDIHDGQNEPQMQERDVPNKSEVAEQPNGQMDESGHDAEPQQELELLQPAQEVEHLEGGAVNGLILSATSMQEIPLDSPSQEEPPVVPVKSPVMPTTPRTGTPRSQTFTPRNSLSAAGTTRHHRSLTLSRGQTVSSVLITSALDVILDSREAKKSAALRDATQRALDMINAENDELINSRTLFEPLRLACETRSEKLMVASLDCISKLIAYSFFTDPPAPTQTDTLTLPDLIVHTITSAYSETTPDAVSLQIVKSLLSLVLSTTTVVHHSSLLKAVRTIYNVFLLSQNSSNQLVAQGGLTQIIHHVFSRCNSNKPSYQADENISSLASEKPSTPSTMPIPSSPTPAVGTSAEEVRKHLPDDAADTSMDTPTEERPRTKAEHALKGDKPNGAAVNLSATPPPDDLDNDRVVRDLTLEDMFVKDAYLVFRALCKLSMKPLITESERDLKSHGMRSKLLSLHLLNTILGSYMSVFLSPSSLLYSGTSGEATHFLDAAKQYLCLAISRNAVSSVPQVFELSVDMFWKVLSGMRARLKKEIEVLLHEIFIPIMEMRTSTWKHKSVLLQLLSRLSQDAQALVDLYINYDCDGEALENIYERLINIISKMSATKSDDAVAKGPGDVVSSKSKDGREVVPPSLSTTALSTPTAANAPGPMTGTAEISLRRQALECLVSVLRSLVTWGTTAERSVAESEERPHSAKHQDSISSQRNGMTNASTERLSISHETSRVSTPDVIDDPGRFESAKQKKTLLMDGIKKFNFKPKRGIQFLIEAGFIPDNDRVGLAKFLMNTEGLNKAMIGEYLGEGDEENVATMHVFVDLLDFTGLPFTDALRSFLQCFRLPGEAQKIDRFMLKFAERYIACNTETAFKNGEAAYVLAYSTILLNTDAHNPQVKRRMSKAEFIRNNRGINDGTDLPEPLLSSIYDEIQVHEIRMKDEVEQDALLPMSSATPGFTNAGRNFQKETYITQATGMMSRTEAMFRTMTRTKGQGQQFFSATHFHHVKPMFEVAWMPFLVGLSGSLQETNDLEIVELCLDGFKSSIHIVCFFDLELQRTSFITTLANFTFLNNLGEMKMKNMEAIKTLLDVAVNEGNNLKSCWRDVLMCVSQLERMQLISGKPEVDKRSRKKLPAEELANESRSTHITVAADMVFSLSHYLSGAAIVDFVQALSDISWEEIQSSGMSDTPRLFSLQKLVEISYYNMTRIRMEWANMWAILGQHFNQICCHPNPHVAYFALDALRQLAMRFLEKEELSHFRFQKDFLRPFQYTMVHSTHADARDLVLQCLQQMIQAKVHNMRSGWHTMFGVFSAAARVNNEHVATTAFEIVAALNKTHFEAIVRNGAFADLTVCITDFCKASRFQKISLLAIGMLRGVIPTMLQSAECMVPTEPSSDSATAPGGDDPTIKFWFPILFSFFDIIMNGEDLEVRQMALESLFTSLKTYGPSFSEDFWDNIFRELIFPIFAVLKSASDVSRFSTQEDMSVWFSTTMVEALRNVIDLYSHHFDLLHRTFEGLLDLLCTCVCQENDTIARIGTSCFQKLVENNVGKLSVAQWEQVTAAFLKLFKVTTPYQLFDETLRVELSSSASAAEVPTPATSSTLLPAPLSPEAPLTIDAPNPVQARRRVFQQIITKCVLQLLLIETTSELFQSKAVYETMPPDQLLRWTGVLDHSYQFAHSFNEDKELRTGLWKVGFMKHLPNLLKQESASASTLITVLLRMYFDTRPGHQASRQQVADHMLPLGLSIMRDYIKLKPETNAKMIVAWNPVIAVLLDGFSRFDESMFCRYLPAVYPLTVDLLSRNMEPEMRSAVQAFFRRTGQVHAIIDS